MKADNFRKSLDRTLRPDRVEPFLRGLAVGYAALTVLLFILGWILVTAGGTIGPWLFPSALVFALGIQIIWLRGKRPIFWWVPLGTILFLFAFTAGASLSLGLWWDGLENHQVRVAELLGNTDEWIAEDHYKDRSWLGHYLSAGIASVLGMEAAKAAPLLLWFPCFWVGYQLFRKLEIGNGWLLPFAFLWASNPILFFQVHSYYLDSYIALLATIGLGGGVLLLEGQRREGWVSLLFALLCLVPAKVVGGGYAVLLIVGLISAGVLLWFRRFGRNRKVFFPLLAFGLCLVVFVGWIASHLGAEKGEILYQRQALVLLLSPDEYDRFLGYEPSSVHTGRPRIQQFLRSAFAETHQGANAPLKIPLTLRQRERQILYHSPPDLRAGGLGPFYSGALILGSIAFVLARGWRCLRANTWWFYGVVTLVPLFILPSFWARWVPLAWTLPVITLATAFVSVSSSTEAYSTGKLRELIRIGGIGVLLANVAIIGWLGWMGAVERSNVVKGELKALEDAQVEIDFGPHPAARRWFQKRSVHHKQISLEDSNQDTRELPFTRVRFRVIPPEAPAHEH